MILLLLGSLVAVSASDAMTGHIVKVLPLFLNLKGRDAVSPSLYDRDAYQAYLRIHTNEVSAIRFDVLWSTSASKATNTNLTLRLELRGIGPSGIPRQLMLEQAVTPHYFRHWTSLPLAGDDFKNFGSVVAWQATLWSDKTLLSAQKSFLW
ncbi:MAG: hypothetical protein WDN00_11755 [Limisphaerales bacterium]